MAFGGVSKRFQWVFGSLFAVNVTLRNSVLFITGAIIGNGDRKRGVHAAPSKKTNVLFLEKNCATLNVINARGYTQICVQSGYDQDGYNYLISSMPEYIIVFIIKKAIANCYEIKKERKKRRETPR